MAKNYHYLSKALIITEQRKTALPNQIIGKRANKQPFKEKDLFQVAERDNPKRAFLFVSKILARHIPVEINNGVMEEAYASLGDELGMLFLKSNAQRILVVSMAETATQMGVNVIEQTVTRDVLKADVIHTTRRPIPNVPICCTLEESHSHHTTHYLHEIPQLNQYDTLVLIDDEHSTGDTAHNLVKALKEQGLEPKNIFTVSFIDWRSDLSVVRDLNFASVINEKAITLYAGQFESHDFNYIEPDGKEIDLQGETPKETKVEFSPVKTLIDYKTYKNTYLKEPITCDKTTYYALVKARLEAKGKKILVVAFGENHYVATKFAKELKEYQAKSVYVCSLTRSPIFARQVGKLANNYPINSKMIFNVADGTKRYLYNVDPTQYDEVYFVMDENYATGNDLSGYAVGLTELTKLHGNVFLLNNCQLDKE